MKPHPLLISLLFSNFFLIVYLHRFKHQSMTIIGGPCVSVAPFVGTSDASVTTSKFKTYICSRYSLPWEVLGLSRDFVHDMGRIRDRFYEMFEAATTESQAEGEQHIQQLCSAFLMLLLINTNKTVTTHVTNNNQTVQSHITVTQEINGLRAALAQQTSQLEQWAFAWEENRKMIQSHHADQSDIIRDLETELMLTRERAKCAPPYFDAVQIFLQQNCIMGNEERVGSAELHSAFLQFVLCHHFELEGEPPTQREFRALLETLGFQYDQVYLRGSNIRGFRGLGMKHSNPALTDEGL